MEVDFGGAWPAGAEDALLSRLAERYISSGNRLDLAGVLSDPECGRLSIVSSFGAESAVLLHLALRARADLPVVFLDTDKHFPETRRYRETLAERLPIANLIVVRPDAALCASEDPQGDLYASRPDACCRIRKTFPLQDVLQDFDGWLTGRKRMHGGTRSSLAYFERDGRHLKINPLATWSADDVRSYFADHGLPAHPLVASGYRSIGCAPCTRPTKPGEAARDGRWSGLEKTECGIHLSPDGRLVRTTRG